MAAAKYIVINEGKRWYEPPCTEAIWDSKDRKWYVVMTEKELAQFLHKYVHVRFTTLWDKPLATLSIADQEELHV